MRKLLWQWVGQVILFLIGLGVEMMPKPDTWLYAVIIWGIAFIWLVVTLIYYFVQKRKKRNPNIRWI